MDEAVLSRFLSKARERLKIYYQDARRYFCMADLMAIFIECIANIIVRFSTWLVWRVTGFNHHDLMFDYQA